MNHAARAKGQPMVALALLTTTWLAARLLTWSSPIALPEIAASTPNLAQTERGIAMNAARPHAQPEPRESRSIDTRFSFGVHTARRAAQARSEGLRSPVRRDRPSVTGVHREIPVRSDAAVVRPAEIAGVRPPDARPAPPGLATIVTKSARRWSFDAWLFARDGNSPLRADAPGGASYGASQVGGIARYRLAGAAPGSPFLFLRGNRALGPRGDADVAIGAGVRLPRELPVVAHAEVRLTETNRGRLVRPSAYLVTAIPPRSLPGRIRADVYAQAGYVGGEFATAFVDGQLTLGRQVAQIGPVSLTAGAGAWGGAQDGVERVDLGPRAELQFAELEMPVRVSVDYRVRVAGNAEPGNGLALTLSTGF